MSSRPRFRYKRPIRVIPTTVRATGMIKFPGEEDVLDVLSITYEESAFGGCGGTVDMIRLPNTGIAAVGFSSVDPSCRSQGVGTGLYERAAKEACRRWGLPLASDTSLSRYSQSFWNKQRAKGRAKIMYDAKSEKRFVLSCPAPKSLAGIRKRRR